MKAFIDYVERIAMILVLDQHLEVTYVFKLLNFVELALASVKIIYCLHQTVWRIGRGHPRTYKWACIHHAFLINLP